MIVVTCEMNFAHEAADKVVSMDEGKILEIESPDIIFNQPKHERTKNFYIGLLIKDKLQIFCDFFIIIFNFSI